MILATQRNIFGLMASENANQLIYHCKRIPLIGKHISDSLYADLSLKKALAAVGTVLKFFGSILGKAFYIGLLMALPAFLLEKSPSARYAAFLHTFTMFSLVGAFLSSALFETSKERYLCVRLMRMNAKAYIVTTALLREAANFLAFLPLVMLTVVLLGGNAAQGFSLTVMQSGFSLLGEVFFLLFYSRTKIILCKKRRMKSLSVFSVWPSPTFLLFCTGPFRCPACCSIRLFPLFRWGWLCWELSSSCAMADTMKSLFVL